MTIYGKLDLLIRHLPSIVAALPKIAVSRRTDRSNVATYLDRARPVVECVGQIRELLLRVLIEQGLVVQLLNEI